MDVNQGELPQRRSDLLLFDGERAALFEASEQASSEGDVVDQSAVDAANAVLAIVGDKLARSCGEYPRFTSGRLEIRVGHEVQRGFFRRGLEHGPAEAVGQQ